MSEEKQEGSRQQADESAEVEIVDAEILESTPAPGTTGKGKGLTLAALGIALLAVVGVAALLVAGYQQLDGLRSSLVQMNSAIGDVDRQRQQLQARIKKAENAVSEQQAASEGQQQAMQAQGEALVAERKRLEQQGKEMQETLQEVYSRVGRSSTAWMAAEAEYLIRVANHRLQLERDVHTAIKALESADGRLRDTGDPGWAPVREQLASDIATLKGVASLDRVGLSARIAGMAKQIKGLEMLGTRPMAGSETDEGLETEESERSLKTMLRDGWEGFKSVMVIRHRDRPVSAMLPPEQQFFVYQNLELQLEAARLALLRGDQTLYGASLKTAHQWLAEFFDGQSAAVKSLQAEILDLQGVQVAPSVPDISGSLLALRQRLKSTDNQGARP